MPRSPAVNHNTAVNLNHIICQSSCMLASIDTIQASGLPWQRHPSDSLWLPCRSGLLPGWRWAMDLVRTRMRSWEHVYINLHWEIWTVNLINYVKMSSLGKNRKWSWKQPGRGGCTETASLDGDVRRVVSCEKRRVNIKPVDQAGDAQLDDAPVMTFKIRLDKEKKVKMKLWSKSKRNTVLTVCSIRVPTHPNSHWLPFYKKRGSGSFLQLVVSST